MRLRFVAAMALISVAPAAASAQLRMPPFVEVRIPKAPTVAAGSEGNALVYELHVTSFEPGENLWTKLEVLDGTSGKVLLTVADSALWKQLTRPAQPTPVGDRAKLTAGQRVIAYVWVPLGQGTSPSQVRHRLTMKRGDAERTLDAAPAVVTPEAVTIGPPLRGGPWLAGNGPSNVSGHRRTIIPLDGTPRVAQRFAIDFVKIDTTAKSFHGDSLNNANYYAEGSDALAVADGIVVEVKDSIPENIPGENSRAVPITLETVGGNHVVLDIGGGRYAFYAHMKPGSLRVKLGQRVKRGEVIGLVGNTGNSTEPHLHFHLADGISPLGSEGIPYRLESLELLGSCNLETMKCSRSAPAAVRKAMPFENQLVRFPN